MPGTDPYVPGHGDATYGVDHYHLALHYKPHGNRLDGEATLACTARERLEEVSLDLYGLRVAKVSANAYGVARFTHRGGKLRIRFRTAVEAGAPFKVKVKYSGSPGTVRSKVLGDAGWEELTDGVIVAAQPHGAPAWFPCNDRPDDKATYSFEVAAPTDYYVAVSGELTGSTRSGASVTWHYEQPARMTTYLATVQIGKYEVTELDASVPLRVVAPHDLRGPEFDASFGRQPEMLAFFEDRFGPYPFDSYTVVVTDDDLEIPLESQSLSTFGRNFASEDWSEVRLVAHELAHQWFGNAVTVGAWKDIWLHEGFACYAEWLWSEASGFQAADAWAWHYHRKLSGLPQDLLLGDPTPELMFDDRVYKRGALTLHALRRTVGDETFFDILRSWVDVNLGGTVDTSEFVAHCSGVADLDLVPLFEAWLFQLPLPSLP